MTRARGQTSPSVLDREFPLQVLVLATVALNCGVTFAQTPPTATETFNLRIKCKQMADEKARSTQMLPMTAADGAALGLSPADVTTLNRTIVATREILFSSHSSRYDAKNNRCYIETYERMKFGRQREYEVESRHIYDAQTDDLLAFAKITNGKKVGMVFDREHQTKIPDNLGWDDANGYIDEMMMENRR